jgi:pimeloyl-ACP methyl ester carboxylesterase
MNTVRSSDGTNIAFDQVGKGSPIILVDGALCYRAFGPSASLSKLLADHYTVFSYDRRGRGESGDCPPYAVEREVEDIDALIKAAGGSAYVFGISSGAALALEAANRLTGIKKLALYEAPFIVDNTHAPRPDDLIARTDALVAAGRRGDTVKLFMKTVGTPWFFIIMMQFMPVWKQLKSVAHTIPYDFRVLGDTGAGKPLPANKWSSARMPALVMDGGKSPAYMRNSAQAIANVLPNSTYRTLEGQTHMVKSEVLAPALVEFFGK